LQGEIEIGTGKCEISIGKNIFVVAVGFASFEIEGYFFDKPKKFEDYQKDIKTKKAIERDIEIIGEAVNRILKKDKDFKLVLKEVLNKNEFDNYADRLTKYFSFYRMNTSIRLTVQGKNGVIQNPVFNPFASQLSLVFFINHQTNEFTFFPFTIKN